jgi:hypothetical protein
MLLRCAGNDCAGSSAVRSGCCAGNELDALGMSSTAVSHVGMQSGCHAASGPPLPPARAAATQCLRVWQRGSFGCETSGTLVMTFDNTFSYLKAKVVRYHIEVTRRAPRPSVAHLATRVSSVSSPHASLPWPRPSPSTSGPGPGPARAGECRHPLCARSRSAPSQPRNRGPGPRHAQHHGRRPRRRCRLSTAGLSLLRLRGPAAPL